MADATDYSVATLDEKTLTVESSDGTFRLARTSHSLTIEVLQRGCTLEQMRYTLTGSGRRVFVFDDTGRSAAFSGGLTDEGQISVSVESDGVTHRVVATPQLYREETEAVLRNVKLPKLRQVPAFVEALREDSNLREILYGKGFIATATHAMSGDCELACTLAADTIGIPIETFMAGWCAACLVHS